MLVIMLYFRQLEMASDFSWSSQCKFSDNALFSFPFFLVDDLLSSPNQETCRPTG